MNKDPSNEEIEALIEEIKEGAVRSAWRRVLSPPNADLDSIVKDPDLLRVNWSEEDAHIMEVWAEQGGHGPFTSDENQAAYDNGIISFGDFIDIFFKAKDKAFKELEKL